MNNFKNKLKIKVPKLALMIRFKRKHEVKQSKDRPSYYLSFKFKLIKVFRV